MMIYNMDLDLRGIVKAKAKEYEMDVEEYFNFVVLCGLYHEQTMSPEDFEAVENYYKGVKGLDIDAEIPQGKSWFNYLKKQGPRIDSKPI